MSGEYTAATFLTRGFIAVMAAAALAACSSGPEPDAAPASAPPTECGDPAQEAGAQVAAVDGHPVTAPELAAYADAHALPLATEDEARAALDALVRFKTAQIEALRLGLTDTVDYADLLTELACGNDDRAAAIDEGRAVYGVSAHDPETYLAYTESTLSDALLNALLAAGEFQPAEDELAAFYDRHRDEYAAGQDTVDLQVLRFEYSEAGTAAAEEVLARSEDGEAWGDVASDHAADPALSDAYDLRVDEANAYDLEKYQSSLYLAADALAAGDTTVVTDDLAGGVLVLHCETRESGGYRTLDEVRPELILRFQDEAYERYLDGLVAAAETETAAALLPLLGTA